MGKLYEKPEAILTLFNRGQDVLNASDPYVDDGYNLSGNNITEG